MLKALEHVTCLGTGTHWLRDCTLTRNCGCVRSNAPTLVLVIIFSLKHFNFNYIKAKTVFYIQLNILKPYKKILKPYQDVSK